MKYANNKPSRREALGTLVATIAAPAIAHSKVQDYKPGPDSLKKEGVPQGKVTNFKHKSQIFGGAERDCGVYVPAQYDGTTPACVMVFQDGGGGMRIPTVFDNLIASKEMPVTVAIFLSPGVLPATDGKTQLPRYNRSLEYDGMGDAYPRFLLEEILPLIEKNYNLKLTQDPEGRGLCGLSSGGIAAFTAAWERPDAFRKVLTFIGSFTDLRGGNRYPDMIRKLEPKPLRIYQQDGSNDQDIYSGHWFIGNNDVAAALKFAGYDHTYVVGTGGHSGQHAEMLMPDALRWLWRDYPGVEARIASDKPQKSRQPVQNFMVAGEAWKETNNAGFITTNLAKTTVGGVYSADKKGKVTWQLGKKKGSITLPFAAKHITLTPDQGFLLIAPALGTTITSARIAADGSLQDILPYYDVFTAHGTSGAQIGGMATDMNGWLYVSTETGIQILDQAGRVNAILVPPIERAIPGGLLWTNGNILNTNYNGKPYARTLNAKGVIAGDAPIKPAGPRL
jgi:gluconolactonase